MPRILFVIVGRLRAPEADGAVLVEPALDHFAELLDRAQSFQLPNQRFFDQAYSEWRISARREIVGEPTSGPWIVAGHQPELFHPGVWLKNFAIARIARQHQGVSLNLNVDVDTFKNASVRAPSWHGVDTPAEDVRSLAVPFDEAPGEMPFEQATIRDIELFRSFGARLAKDASQWTDRPFIASYWPRVLAEDSPIIGERFAAARRGVEREWGAGNREIKVSQLCKTAAFARFAGAILADLPRWHAIYNESVRDYRTRNRIRSRNHPVPDLATDGDWLESPFWVWRADVGRRLRLFARCINNRLELRADSEFIGQLSAESPLEEWPGFEDRGWKIRTRALTTTLFARLALADLFVHGLGGGLYDRLADAISLRYFGAAPPAFAIITGTLRLNLPKYEAGPPSPSERDLLWNPQRHMDNEDTRARQSLIANSPASRRGRQERYHLLRKNLAKIIPSMDAELGRARNVELDGRARRTANEVLTSRSYSFVLHSEKRLREFIEGAITF